MSVPDDAQKRVANYLQPGEEARALQERESRLYVATDQRLLHLKWLESDRGINETVRAIPYEQVSSVEKKSVPEESPAWDEAFLGIVVSVLSVLGLLALRSEVRQDMQMLVLVLGGLGAIVGLTLVADAFNTDDGYNRVEISVPGASSLAFSTEPGNAIGEHLVREAGG